MTKPKPKPKKTTKPAKKPASVVVAPKKQRGGQIIHDPTPEKKAEIIERLTEGEFWTWIRRSGWREDGKNAGQPMPSTTTLWEWEEADPAFAEKIARAREAGQLALLEEGYCIADDSSGDYRVGPKGGLQETDAPARMKLRLWYRLEMADRINPGKWAKGKRIMDGEGNPVMPSEIRIVGVAAKKAVDAMAGVTGVKPKRSTK